MSRLVVVTGAAGYVGSVVVGNLLKSGYRVNAIDAFFFEESALRKYEGNPKLKIVRRDIREVTPHDLEGAWGVVDLAALSNDPSGDLDPRLTQDINYRGRARVAEAALRAGVNRYVFASSCAVYGCGTDACLDERSPVRPLTVYARCCTRAEELIRGLSQPGFDAVALRFATIFGLSPRMRFDLVVNIMTLNAYESGRIVIWGGGQQWRPLVHVQDVALAIMTTLAAPAALIRGEAFNIGHINLQVREIAAIICDTLPLNIETQVMPDGVDARNYNVSFERAAAMLGFRAHRSVADGAREILEALQAGLVVHDERTETVSWYRHLLSVKRSLVEGNFAPVVA
jgi:nucleoside-diphosphate-sugar epimerase